MSRLKELHKFGQSPWYDNIERGMLLSGRLKKMIEEDGIVGVTTNPSIFEKAINGSADYDPEIVKLGRKGKSVLEIYDELTTQDVDWAADLLKGTYSSSKGLDGYVSIEVSPHLARDAKGTVAEAERLFKKLGRENIMIKVPATWEGIGAIRALIAEGINVNATLIFSQQHYRGVAEAYLKGLEERAGRGQDVSKTASVASLFVSRIDTYVDKILEGQKTMADLKGKAAVAQSKAIYEIYRQLFSGERWKKLESKGAKIQRLLFGSTSTKNPAYRDVKYVEEIIGEGTINTIPEATVAAFRDHGTAKATLDKGIGEAKQTLQTLKGFGIDVELICQQIQDDGVQAFVDSYDKLISSLEQKKRSVS
jgi:transaldolase/transaldolase/glucose-6-phosphate isomerase